MGSLRDGRLTMPRLSKETVSGQWIQYAEVTGLLVYMGGHLSI
jgi:hypothetical protein